MKVYLVSNNLLLSHLKYDNDANLDIVRMIRPLSIEGEKVAKKISDIKDLENVSKIYTSFYSSSLMTAKYLSEKLELEMFLSEDLNDCKVGILGSKNMKMVKGMQEHDINYKLQNGESLVDVGNRIDKFIKEKIDDFEDCVLFTHKRSILGLLLKYCKFDYNLHDNLIVLYNEQVIYDDSETEYDIYELEIENNQVKNIKRI